MKEVKTMENRKTTLQKLVTLSMLVAIGVVISPILRVEGMCPMAHLINVVCAVLLGPWYSLLCAFLIGIIRMTLMGIPPLALTGAVFGAFLSGMLYRFSKGNLIFAVIGEVMGTGIIGAIVSYPVMTFIWNREGLSWLFYIPSFITATLIGGSIAYVFLKQLSKIRMLVKMQKALGSAAYESNDSVLSDSLGIAALGVIGYLVILIVVKLILSISTGWALFLPYIPLTCLIITAIVYFVIKQSKISKD